MSHLNQKKHMTKKITFQEKENFKIWQGAKFYVNSLIFVFIKFAKIYLPNKTFFIFHNLFNIFTCSKLLFLKRYEKLTQERN